MHEFGVSCPIAWACIVACDVRDGPSRWCSAGCFCSLVLQALACSLLRALDVNDGVLTR